MAKREDQSPVEAFKVLISHGAGASNMTEDEVMSFVESELQDSFSDQQRTEIDEWSRRHMIRENIRSARRRPQRDTDTNTDTEDREFKAWQRDYLKASGGGRVPRRRRGR